MAYTKGDYERRGKAKRLSIRYVRKRFGQTEYRRRVPEWLRPVVGHREWFERLPADQEGALRRAAALTRKYDRLTSPDIRRLVPLGTKTAPERTHAIEQIDETGNEVWTRPDPTPTRALDVGSVYDTIHAMLQEPLTADGMPGISDVLSLPSDDMRMLLALRRVVEEMAADDTAQRERLQPLKDAIDETEAPAGENTLGDVAEQWLKAAKYPQSTKDTYDSRVRRALEFFGPDFPIKNLTSAMVREWRNQVELLPGATGLPTKLRKASMSVLLRYRADNPDTTQAIMPNSVRDHLKALQAFCAWAVDEEIITTNPVNGVKPPKDERKDAEETKQPALPWPETPAFMAALRERQEPMARVVEFAILCASRTVEVVGMQWSEIDLRAKVWTCPASRVKGSTESHIVPLSDRALELLGAPGVDSVFGYIPANGLLRFVQRQMDRPDITMHGFRSSFATWADEVTEYPDQMIEIALAHKVGSAVSRRYRRKSMVERRRAMMEDWATFCASNAIVSSSAPYHGAFQSN